MFLSAAQHLITIQDVFRFAVSQFNQADLYYGHGAHCAVDEAAYLILSTLHLPIDQVDPFLAARLLPDEINKLLTVIHTRVTTRCPAAYLTQEAWLQNYRFYVDERVLIPRSFIAELLIQQGAPWISQAQTMSDGLDLCTGSGCLAIIMADNFPHMQVDAVDLSLLALEVAQKNVQAYQLAPRISLIHSNLFEAIQGKKYDLIISNPPYVDEQAMAQLPQEYLHEPQMALASGLDGLDLTRQILQQAKYFLKPEGVLIVEIGHHRAALEQAYPHLPFTWLATEQGEGFVFILTYDALEAFL